MKSMGNRKEIKAKARGGNKKQRRRKEPFWVQKPFKFKLQNFKSLFTTFI